MTGTEVVRLRSEMKQFEGFSAIRAGSVTIGGDPGVDPQQVTQSSVSANFFRLLGSGPDIGRGFIAGEDAAGGPRVAVISRLLWTQRFGADRTLIGKTALIDGTPTTIVGVLPAAFRFEAQTSLSAATGDIDVYMEYVASPVLITPCERSPASCQPPLIVSRCSPWVANQSR